MEGVCDLKRTLALALLLIFASLLLLDSYHVISPQSQTKKNYGLPSPASSGSPHAGTQHHELQSKGASALVTSLGGIPCNSSFVNEKKGSRSMPKVEIGLRRARAAIRKAILDREQRQEPGDSYVPTGDIYRNAGAFHRSYREMEKRFKIFVYREGEPPLVHDGPCVDIYTTEGRFIEELELGSRFVTSNPEEAHVYFLPFSVTMMVTYIYVPNTYNKTPLKRFVRDYVNIVAGKYPFWNRSLGADHFMLSCHDWVTISFIEFWIFSDRVHTLNMNIVIELSCITAQQTVFYQGINENNYYEVKVTFL